MSVLLRRLWFGLRRRGRTRRQGIAEREVHDRDLLLLFDDDPLGEPHQSLVLAVAQLRDRHVDGSLVVWDHHAGEVSVRIAGEGDVHLRVHAGNRVAHHRLEPLLPPAWRCWCWAGAATARARITPNDMDERLFSGFMGHSTALRAAARSLLLVDFEGRSCKDVSGHFAPSVAPPPGWSSARPQELENLGTSFSRPPSRCILSRHGGENAPETP